MQTVYLGIDILKIFGVFTGELIYELMNRILQQLQQRVDINLMSSIIKD
jgi:hypothetical protein